MRLDRKAVLSVFMAEVMLYWNYTDSLSETWNTATRGHLVEDVNVDEIVEHY